ncbi:MAG: thiamine-phosphate kinase [Polynucleobacter sp. 24-46-87]|uniref:thiamine-phosphate kinase n=1 Tax=unclassified Polynucleobacter TaxID=2640945 RepID=UPI000BC8A7BC|nr:MULTISPECIES: thiamine-phosphate kinase [unclassified Polynucleobacter]OYY15892.1 MAG: thiamine-phosphate kinase [Polynucleobacter sp. 35-46-11]OZA12589.1 MAG: thiamine-phosphate kinase [Polynucleobacter sp. 24-46-87]OZA75697.1 MAG: thiamine-phosphate kinase [Polynucleobacter sp. 39-46-10]
MQSQTSPLGEFDLIQRFFKTQSELMLSKNPGSVKLGIGDDCALLNIDPTEEIAITSDMLVSGRHFLPDANPEWLGWKALAVNLSDLAAMGAKPAGFTLALALPESNSAWLEAFSKGLFAIANQFTCPLIGGDTTAGPLNICITAFGSIPKGKAIYRSGALVGDDIWVSGTVGDARLALAALRHEIKLSKEDLASIEARMHQPTPRLDLGIALRGIANSVLDISDGLLGDLRHILEQSGKDAEISLGQIPKSATLGKQVLAIQNQYSASGGDDYELCFTAPSSKRDAIAKISADLNLALTQIGSIKSMQSSAAEIHIVGNDGKELDAQEAGLLLKSFDHFA